MKYARVVRLCAAILLLASVGCGGGGSGIVLPPPAPPTSDFSLSFDGVDDVASTAGGYTINEFTIEAWIKPTSVTPSGFRGIVGRTGRFFLTLDDANAGQWVLTQCAGACNSVSSPLNNLTTGTWQHLAGTYDGTTLRIYLDGALQATAPKTGDTANPPEIVFGRWSGTFHGLIDEVRLWNVVRTPTQIQADKDRILSGTEAGLIGYWRFEEGAGQASGDGSAGSNAAQLGSTAGTDADDPTWNSEGAPVS